MTCMNHRHDLYLYWKIEETNQRAACQYKNCGNFTSSRVDGMWLCEEHMTALKLYIVERKLDRS